MKITKNISVIILSGILLLLCACGGAGNTVVGIWQEQAPVTVLGPEENNSEEEITIVFTFNEDKTGSMEHKYAPDSELADLSKSIDFTWEIKENTLTIEYGNSRTEQYEVSFEKDKMELSGRTPHSLTRVK